MRCYTFVDGRVIKGLAVCNDKKLGTVVFLGEKGRGRWYEKIGLFYKNPAEVKNGIIYEANPVKIILKRSNYQEKSFFVLARPNNGNDPRALVRINTAWRQTNISWLDACNSVGSWKAVKGNPQDLVIGYGAHDITGRLGKWNDGLVLMSPGDVIRVKPVGGDKTKPYALFYHRSRSMLCMPFEYYWNMSQPR